MNKEQKKYSLIIQHGMVKGLNRATKELKRLLSLDLISLKANLELAKSEYSNHGHCEFEYHYREEKARAECGLDEGKRKEMYLNHMGLAIQRESTILKKMKENYREEYGVNELLLVTNLLEMMGKERAKGLSHDLRIKKEKCKCLSHIAQVLVGKRLENHLYKIGRELETINPVRKIIKEFKKKSNELRDVKLKISCNPNFKKEVSIYAELARKNEEDIMNVAISFIDILNKLDSEEEDAKLSNFKKIIVDNCMKMGDR